jgi:hypothetical protein
MQITIENVEVKKDKNDKEYYLVTDTQGQKFYHFAGDINIIGKLANGRGAVLDIEHTGGEYPKITAAKLLHYKPLTNKLSSDEIKNRSVAISYAKDLVCAGKSDLADIEKLADRILAYVGGINA